MKKTIVLIKNVKYNYQAIREIEDDYDRNRLAKDDELVVLTEEVEVDLPELEGEAVINAEVAIIDKQIIKVQADCEASLTALEGRKQELLAIPYKEG